MSIWLRTTMRIRASGTTKDYVGSVNRPVSVGGVTINPGDIVVLDADGGVVVPAADQEAVLNAAAERVAREDEARARYKAGSLTYDMHGLRAKVEGHPQA